MGNSNKLLIILITCTVFISINTSCRNTVNKDSIKTTVEYPEDSIKVVLRNFYSTFINFWDTSQYLTPVEVIQAVDSIENIYCTKRLMKLLHDLTNQPILDWDPFLNSQMVDKLMLKTLVINKDSVSNKLYIVSYIYGPNPNKIRLIISKEGSKFKIDSLPDIPIDMIKIVRPTIK